MVLHAVRGEGQEEQRRGAKEQPGHAGLVFLDGDRLGALRGLLLDHALVQAGKIAPDLLLRGQVEGMVRDAVHDHGRRRPLLVHQVRYVAAPDGVVGAWVDFRQDQAEFGPARGDEYLGRRDLGAA